MVDDFGNLIVWTAEIAIQVSVFYTSDTDEDYYDPGMTVV